MAYGVKFRLEFSDVKGNLRRVEILQKDYSGAVFDLVGQSNPCIIKWDGDDDFYSPIIGSSCELNLFETADTNYDQFYRAGEREYKVRISTGERDDKVWNTESDQWEQANYNWEEEKSYEIYWEGWLQTDQYQESLQPYPNPIKLVAYDGLGTLNAYDAPYSNSPTGGYDSNEDTMFFYLYYILNNLQLDLDIYVANTVRKSGGNPNETLYHDIILNEYGVFDNLDFRNAKDLLESFLKATNSRVFQSQGRWYIVSNSNLIDKNINQLFNFNIGLSIKNQLIDTGEEIIQYNVYDRLGVFKFSTDENILLKAPTELKPVGADLYKEYLKPYHAVKYDVKLTDLKYINQNPQLLYDDHQWILGPNTTINTDENYSLVGFKSIKTTVHGINITDPYVVISNEIDTVISDDTKEFDLGFSFYIDPDTTQTNFSSVWKYNMEIYVKGIASNGDIVYYDFKNNEWSELAFLETVNNKKRRKKKSFTKVGTWQNYNVELRAYDEIEGDFKIQMHIRYPNFSVYPNPSLQLVNATYFDKIYIAEKSDVASEMLMSNTQDVNKTRTAEYEIDNLFISNYLGADGFQGGYDGYFERPRDFTIMAQDFYSLDRIITQEILNDFRDFVPRYEGTFYNLIDEPIPVSLHNKVWINFSSGAFTEGASCYIDSMKYDVKANEYEITMHTPNQTNDVNSSFKVELKK